jgi:hypothetical protein
VSNVAKGFTSNELDKLSEALSAFDTLFMDFGVRVSGYAYLDAEGPAYQINFRDLTEEVSGHVFVL